MSKVTTVRIHLAKNLCSVPVDAPTGSIAADSLAPRRVGALVFPIAQAYIQGVVLVSDGAIREAQEALWNRARIVAEPGGAAAMASLLSGAYLPAAKERVGVLISGANTTAVSFDDPAAARGVTAR